MRRDKGDEEACSCCDCSMTQMILDTQLLLQVLNKTLNRKYMIFRLRICPRFGSPCCPNGNKNFPNNALLKEEPKRGHTHYPVDAYLLHKGTNQNCLSRLSSIQEGIRLVILQIRNLR